MSARFSASGLLLTAALAACAATLRPATVTGVAARTAPSSPATLISATATATGIEISTGPLEFVCEWPETPSAVQQYDVMATNVTEAVTVSASPSFVVSLSPAAGFAPSVQTAAPVGGNIAPTTIYVQFFSRAFTAHFGSITHTCAGEPPVVLAVSGTVVGPSSSKYDNYELFDCAHGGSAAALPIPLLVLLAIARSRPRRSRQAS
jgi:hypothetical protein